MLQRAGNHVWEWRAVGVFIPLLTAGWNILGGVSSGSHTGTWAANHAITFLWGGSVVQHKTGMIIQDKSFQHLYQSSVVILTFVKFMKDLLPLGFFLFCFVLLFYTLTGILNCTLFRFLFFFYKCTSNKCAMSLLKSRCCQAEFHWILGQRRKRFFFIWLVQTAQSTGSPWIQVSDTDTSMLTQTNSLPLITTQHERWISSPSWTPSLQQKRQHEPSTLHLFVNSRRDAISSRLLANAGHRRCSINSEFP